MARNAGSGPPPGRSPRWRWNTLDGYFGQLQKTGSSVNIASYVSAGQARDDVLGYADRARHSDMLPLPPPWATCPPPFPLDDDQITNRTRSPPPSRI
jgi:hypothetical protein